MPNDMYLVHPEHPSQRTPKLCASATRHQALRWPTFRAANGLISERRAQLRTTSFWMDEHKTFLPITYAFESGHRFWDEADEILRGIGQYPELKKDYRYRTHFALEKKESYGLQAADMLAGSIHDWTSVSHAIARWMHLGQSS